MTPTGPRIALPLTVTHSPLAGAGAGSRPRPGSDDPGRRHPFTGGVRLSIVARGLLSLLIVGAATVARAQSSGQGTVTTGEVPGINCGVVTACTSGLRVNFNPQMCGIVTAPDGSRWEVPSAVHPGPAAVDVYNDCTGPGDIPDYLAKVPTVVIDPDGVEITGYIFADNYYELYVNGTFVAKDGIGMTPFNSTVVRFRARYPMTYAIKAVDWETHPGVGLEYDRYNVGDGGFIAHFSDGTVTGPGWKTETFYIAPLGDPSCVTTTNGRDSTACPSQGQSGGDQGSVRRARIRGPARRCTSPCRRTGRRPGSTTPPGRRRPPTGLRTSPGPPATRGIPRSSAPPSSSGRGICGSTTSFSAVTGSRPRPDETLPRCAWYAHPLRRPGRRRRNGWHR